MSGKEVQLPEEHPNYKILKKIGKLKSLPKKPLVSVIIPAHDEEKYVWKAIESILKQTYKPVELIVVDNGSTDSTFEVISKYKDKIKIVRNKENLGFGGGCNSGWKISKGDLLMFFDSDEVYGENYVKDLIAPILQGKDICTMHHMEKIANIENLWARAFGKRYTIIDGRGKIFTIIRRDVFEKLGPFDPSLGYGDDKTLFIKHGLTSFGVDADISHHNPSGLKVHWKHGKWIGKSYKYPYLTILSLPVFPLYVIYKSIKQFSSDPYWKLLYFLPVYHTVKYFSYFVGAIDRLKGKARTT